MKMNNSPIFFRDDAYLHKISANKIIVDELSQKQYFVGNYFSNIDDVNLDPEWNDLVETWNSLPQDQFMADGGKYRQRRYSKIIYDSLSKKLEFQKHNAFFQSKDLNKLNGGVDRNFECITPYVANHPIIKNMIDSYISLFGSLGFGSKWMIFLHQVPPDVRIVASFNFTGRQRIYSCQNIH